MKYITKQNKNKKQKQYGVFCLVYASFNQHSLNIKSISFCFGELS